MISSKPGDKGVPKRRPPRRPLREALRHTPPCWPVEGVLVQAALLVSGGNCFLLNALNPPEIFFLGCCLSNDLVNPLVWAFY